MFGIEYLTVGGYEGKSGDMLCRKCGEEETGERGTVRLLRGLTVFREPFGEHYLPWNTEGEIVAVIEAGERYRVKFTAAMGAEICTLALRLARDCVRNQWAKVGDWEPISVAALEKYYGCQGEDDAGGVSCDHCGAEIIAPCDSRYCDYHKEDENV